MTNQKTIIYVILAAIVLYAIAVFSLDRKKEIAETEENENPAIHNAVFKTFVGYPDGVMDENERLCLAKAIFFESRNQPVDGQLGVAAVVLNRVKVGMHPNTICEVVYQGCQFSWVCEKSKQYDPAKHKNYIEREAWQHALELAKFSIMAYNYGAFRDVTFGATFFHARYVSPYWTKSRNFEKTVRIKDHIFYRTKD